MSAKKCCAAPDGSCWILCYAQVAHSECFSGRSEYLFMIFCCGFLLGFLNQSTNPNPTFIHHFFFSEFLCWQAALGVSEKSLVAELAFQVMPMQVGEILGGESSGKTTSDG